MKICIEGNIGAGKSTVIEMLQRDRFRVVPEPLEQWGAWLKEFYKDKKRWAFAFQMKVLHSFASLKDTNDAIIERSIGSGRYVFSQMLVNQGSMMEKEWAVYRQYYDLVSWTPQVVIYIKTDPHVCLERVAHRHREGEDAIDIEYLKKLDFHYNNFIKYASTETKVHVLDGNRPAEDIYSDVLSILEQYNTEARFVCA